MTLPKPALAALAAVLLAPTAAADQRAPEDGFDFEIQVTAADVASPEAATKFLNRLERRVQAKCGGNNLRGTLAVSVSQHRADVRDCVDTTMRATVDNLRSPTLVQAYDMRRG